MKTFDGKALKLYAVTDRAWLDGRTLAQVVDDVLRGGATILQLREKCLADDAFLAEARELKALCASYGVPLIINDNVAVARAIGAGIHVGQGDAPLQSVRAELGPEAVIGVSCQTVAQALEAERNGADYLGVGAVFPTSTKLDADYVDSRELAAICAAVKIPVVAIGGISEANAMSLAGSGIAGIAVVSALFAAPNPEAATRRMLAQMNELLAVPVPKTSGAIVDLDGTILDSIPYWERLGDDFLAARGKKGRNDMLNILNSMEVDEASEYLKREYDLAETVAEVKAGLLDAVRCVYAEKAPLLPHARTMLARLHDDGVRLALFTAAEQSSAVAALKRNNVFELFDCVISTQDIGFSKSCPEAFLYVLGRLGTALEQTEIYEDAVYAIEGARKSGMKVITPEEFSK